MLRGRDDDETLAGVEAGTEEARDGLEQKRLVLVELNQVMAVLRRAQHGRRAAARPTLERKPGIVRHLIAL